MAINKFEKFAGIVAALALRQIAAKMESINPQATRVAAALAALAGLAGGCSVETIDPLLLRAATDLVEMLDVLHNLRARDSAAATRLAAAVIERLSTIERMRRLRPGDPLPDYYQRREDVCLALLVVAYQRQGDFALPEPFMRRDEFLLIVGEDGALARALYALGFASPSASDVGLAA